MFKSHMLSAIKEAKIAGSRGEIPVGAVIIDSKNNIISKGHNLTKSLFDPSGHAEIIAIRRACAMLQTDRLLGCSLYVTLEPCSMCAGAISLSKISKLYYGASDPKSGGVEKGPKIFSHRETHSKPEIFHGFFEEEISHMMTEFFQTIRHKNKLDTNQFGPAY